MGLKLLKQIGVRFIRVLFLSRFVYSHDINTDYLNPDYYEEF